jgi:hypothetical protein
MQTIDNISLVHLVKAGAVQGTVAVGQGNGWAVNIRYGSDERPLATKDSKVRHFRHLETLVAYLKKIGINNFEVKAENYDPDVRTVQRPDTAAAMKRAHEAAAYDKWFRAQVQKGIDDPRPRLQEDEADAQIEADLRDGLRKSALQFNDKQS